MANTKDKVQIHIVSSVKGGCGKTAFSLFKAMDFAIRERGSDSGNRNVPVIWIDADFKGTASKTLFYGENKKAFRSMQAGDTIEEYSELYEKSPLGLRNRLCFSREYITYTINDYLKEEIQSLEKMIIHGYVLSKQEKSGYITGYINGMIDFIFSSGAMSDKKLFNYGNGLPTIEIGRFTYLMRAMLSRLIEMGETRTRAVKESTHTQPNYKHVIIDMPPGDDAYSSALLRMVRQLAEEKQYKDKIEIHLYTLATSDRGHMSALLESLRDTCERLRNYGHKEKIYAVLSEIRDKEFDPEEQYIIQIHECRDQIRRVLSDNELEIEILKCEFQPDYYTFSRSFENKEFGYNIKEYTNE